MTTSANPKESSMEHPFVVEHERRVQEEGHFYGFSDDDLLASLEHWQSIRRRFGTTTARQQVEKLEAELDRRTA